MVDPSHTKHVAVGVPSPVNPHVCCKSRTEEDPVYIVSYSYLEPAGKRWTCPGAIPDGDAVKVK